VPTTTPDVTVVLPVYRAARVIKRCLEAVARQETNRSVEVIVVDDGSDDGTSKAVEQWIGVHSAEIQARCDVRLVRQPHRGPSAARNLGAHQARGSILLFTDADCEPCPDWLENMVRPFEDPLVCGTKGTYETRQRSWVARLVQVEYQEKYERMERFDSIDFIDTYSAAFRREAFLSLRGFDESFPSASVEDQEFSFRMADRGYRMRFVPDARVGHHHATTLRQYARKKFRIAYYKSYLLVRHPSRAKGDTHTPPTLVFQIPLTYMLLAAVCAVPFWGPAWPLIAFVALVDVSCMVGTLSVCRRQDPALVLFVPLLLAIRSLALGAGLFLGTIRFRLMGIRSIQRQASAS
jgi:cellulose synthase/poly-beta-1,6-N-acetylglucosamine synthase-like glycosyltransferase